MPDAVENGGKTVPVATWPGPEAAGDGGPKDFPVLMPKDVAPLAVSSGRIRAPEWGKDVESEDYGASEGPSFRGPEDAIFHEGVEEVVSDWQDGSNIRTLAVGEADALSPFAGSIKASLLRTLEEQDSGVVEDTFFLEGLEEVEITGEAGAGLVGYMPPVDVPAMKSEEHPAPIVTTPCMGEDDAEAFQEVEGPPFSLEDDATFLDLGLECECAGTGLDVADASASTAGLDGDDFPNRVHLRLRTSSRNSMEGPTVDRADEHLLRAISCSRTPDNTPADEEGQEPCLDALEGLASGLILQPYPEVSSPPASMTPNNTPLETGTTNTPTANHQKSDLNAFSSRFANSSTEL